MRRFTIEEFLGRTFNQLTIHKITRKGKVWIARCECVCGTVKDVLLTEVKSGGTKSCGCRRRQAASKTKTKEIPNGTRFTRLQVLSTFKKDCHLWARCRCICGTVLEVHGANLRNGSRQSCGCLRLERSRASTTTHGESITMTPEYRAWRGICMRCRDSKNKKYGGRGITIDPEWENSYPTFLKAVGRRPSPHHTIGRIKNDVGYVPGNVRWETQDQQVANKRTTRWIVFKGQRKALCTWARELNRNYSMLLYRLNAGWTPERAFTECTRKLQHM